MSVDFSIDFAARVGARLADFGRHRDAAEDVLEEAETRLQQDLLEVWPVDTGTSLQAWDNYISGMRWVLRNAVEYAVYVHHAGDDRPIWEYLEAKAEEYAQDAVFELRRLLAMARREQGAQAPLFGSRGIQQPARGRIVGDAVFAALARAFQQPGRGARQRLRERFPDQPIGRALSRRRSRERAR